jgi:hypothetical protein
MHESQLTQLRLHVGLNHQCFMKSGRLGLIMNFPLLIQKEHVNLLFSSQLLLALQFGLFQEFLLHDTKQNFNAIGDLHWFHYFEQSHCLMLTQVKNGNYLCRLSFHGLKEELYSFDEVFLKEYVGALVLIL